MEHLRSGFDDQFQMLQHCIASMTADTTNEVGSRVGQKNGTGSSAESQLLSHLPWHQYQQIFGLQNFAIQLQQHRLLIEVANQIHAQIPRSSAEDMQMPSEINKSKIGLSEEVYSPERLENVQCNEKSTMIMQSNGNIAVDAEQVNSSVLMKMGNLGHENYSAVPRKMYPCAVCGKGFKQKNYLGNHMMIHTGKKPFECHICNKFFRQKTTLNHHLLVHTNQKPHKCDVCQRLFRHNSALNWHRKRSHTKDKE